MTTTVTRAMGPRPLTGSNPPAPGSPLPVDTHLWVSPWTPEEDSGGHDPRSSYVEQYWLGVIGPTSVLLLRHLARHLDAFPEGGVLDLPTTARSLGVSWGPGRHSPMNRTVRRLVEFGLAREPRPAELQVRRRLPHLDRSRIKRLPLALRQAHSLLSPPAPLGPNPRPSIEPERLRTLVHTMVDLNMGPAAVEEQLRTWGVIGHQLEQACSLARSMSSHPSRSGRGGTSRSVAPTNSPARRR